MSRLENARAALLASGVKAPEDVVREVIRRNAELPGMLDRTPPPGPQPNDYASAELQVECPRGHFVADVMVLAVDTWAGVTLLPEIGYATEATHGFSFEEPQNWTDGDIAKLLWSRVRVTCAVSKCKYRGSFKRDMLEAELAEAAAAAAARHAIYRLKS